MTTAVSKTISWATVLSLAPLATATAQAGPTDWPSVNYTAGANRYSPLTQITADNVGTLERAWSIHLAPAGYDGPFREAQGVPLVIDNTMYLTSPYGMVLALDATTGSER